MEIFKTSFAKFLVGPVEIQELGEMTNPFRVVTFVKQLMALGSITQNWLKLGSVETTSLFPRQRVVKGLGGISISVRASKMPWTVDKLKGI